MESSNDTEIILWYPGLERRDLRVFLTNERKTQKNYMAYLEIFSGHQIRTLAKSNASPSAGQFERFILQALLCCDLWNLFYGLKAIYKLSYFAVWGLRFIKPLVPLCKPFPLLKYLRSPSNKFLFPLSKTSFWCLRYL